MSAAMDDIDLALINTLQAYPRISWADASTVVGVSPGALASRWDRLRQRGTAWVTASPGDLDRVTVAFINIQCAPGSAADVSTVLARDSRIVTIDVMSPGALLHVTVMTWSMSAFTELVTTDLPAISSITNLDAFLATAVHRGGNAWRVNALGPAQQAAVDRVAPRGSGRWRERKDSDNALIEGLFADGRASAADLARATGRSQPTVRRQLASLLTTDHAVLRCDVSYEDAGWPVASTWWVKVPPVKNQQTAQSLTSLAAVRFCASVTGSSNMLFTVYTRALGDLLRIERAIGENLPWLEVQEITVHLRADKRMGWLLNDRGRATGELVLPEIFQRMPDLTAPRRSTG
jgi:DNA-binding Lrp family transcriptional regulator